VEIDSLLAATAGFITGCIEAARSRAETAVEEAAEGNFWLPEMDIQRMADRFTPDSSAIICEAR